MLAETKRLKLRVLEEEDLEPLMSIWGDPVVMHYCGGAGDRVREQRALAFYRTHQIEKGFSPYAVVLKDEDKLIGVCGFNPAGEDYDAELLYHFAKPYWGLGYAYEAAEAVIEHVKKHLELKVIGAAVSPENKGSERILVKLGFKAIGSKWFEDTQRFETEYRLQL